MKVNNENKNDQDDSDNDRYKYYKGINDLNFKIKEPIVISGLSGRYSEADNIEEFWDKLISKTPLYSSDGRRWPVGMFYVSFDQNFDLFSH